MKKIMLNNNQALRDYKNSVFVYEDDFQIQGNIKNGKLLEDVKSGDFLNYYRSATSYMDSSQYGFNYCHELKNDKLFLSSWEGNSLQFHSGRFLEDGKLEFKDKSYYTNYGSTEYLWINDNQCLLFYGKTINQEYLAGVVITLDYSHDSLWDDTITFGPSTQLSNDLYSGDDTIEAILLPNGKVFVLYGGYRNDTFKCSIVTINEDLTLTLNETIDLDITDYFNSDDKIFAKLLPNGKILIHFADYNEPEKNCYFILTINEDSSINVEKKYFDINFTYNHYYYHLMKPIFLSDDKYFYLVKKERYLNYDDFNYIGYIYTINLDDNTIDATSFVLDTKEDLDNYSSCCLLPGNKIYIVGRNVIDYRSGDLIANTITINENNSMQLGERVVLAKNMCDSSPQCFLTKYNNVFIAHSYYKNFYYYGKHLVATIDFLDYKIEKYKNNNYDLVTNRTQNNSIPAMAIIDGKVGEFVEVYVPKENE